MKDLTYKIESISVLEYEVLITINEMYVADVSYARKKATLSGALFSIVENINRYTNELEYDLYFDSIEELVIVDEIIKHNRNLM